MRNILTVLLFAGLILTSVQLIAQKKLDNTFYCQNTMWGFENKPETPEQKAKLMKEIGFDGLEGFGYNDFYELKKALDNQGLAMPVNYVGLDFTAEGKLKGNALKEIKEMISASQKGSVIYFHLKNENYTNDRASGDKIIIPVLRDLAKAAAKYDVKLCVYPHINLYCETLAHSVRLAQMVGMKNFGAALNLCHLLKVEGSEGLDNKLKTSTRWLFAVNICGADNGDTKQMGWNRLIQPLGQGSFDTYAFVKSLKDNGYEGPFGVQCYNLKGDVVKTLNQTMDTWKAYKKRFAEEK